MGNGNVELAAFLRKDYQTESWKAIKLLIDSCQICLDAVRAPGTILLPGARLRL